MTTPREEPKLDLDAIMDRVKYAEHESNCIVEEDGDVCTCIVSDVVDLVREYGRLRMFARDAARAWQEYIDREVNLPMANEPMRRLRKYLDD